VCARDLEVNDLRYLVAWQTIECYFGDVQRDLKLAYI
jgi:hypothetical protein